MNGWDDDLGGARMLGYVMLATIIATIAVALWVFL